MEKSIITSNLHTKKLTRRKFLENLVIASGGAVIALWLNESFKHTLIDKDYNNEGEFRGKYIGNYREKPTFYETNFSHPIYRAGHIGLINGKGNFIGQGALLKTKDSYTISSVGHVVEHIDNNQREMQIFIPGIGYWAIENFNFQISSRVWGDYLVPDSYCYMNLHGQVASDIASLEASGEITPLHQLGTEALPQFGTVCASIFKPNIGDNVEKELLCTYTGYDLFTNGYKFDIDYPAVSKGMSGSAVHYVNPVTKELTNYVLGNIKLVDPSGYSNNCGDIVNACYSSFKAQIPETT